MGLNIDRLLRPTRVSSRIGCATVCLLALCGGALGPGQTPAYKARARRFLAGRTGAEARDAAGLLGSRLEAAGLQAARRQHLAMLAKPRTAGSTANWQAVGPAQIASLNYGNVTGRVTSVAIDPADVTGNTIYLGTTGGGVWKSTNAAGKAANVTFTPLTDTLTVFNPGDGSSAIASLSIGAVSVANGVVLAGTGDPNDALDSYYGSGLLRSADGGSTWTLVQQSNDGVNGIHLWTGLGFAGFAWSGVAANTVVAAVSDAAEGALVNASNAVYSTRGLYFSNDAGATWQMSRVLDPAGSGTQVVQTPQAGGANQGGNAATAVAWNPFRQRFYAAVRYHGYYESADGSVWTRLANQPGIGLAASACPPNSNTTGSVGCPIFRGALAVEPASGDMYAFTVDGNNLDQGIWRDACAAKGGVCASSTVAFGAQLDSTPLEEGFGNTTILQGDYDLSLAAVASETQTVVLAGTIDLSRCVLTTADASGAACAFRNTTNAFNGCAAAAMVAPAQHAIATLAGEGPLVYIGNDGGLWRSMDGVAETGAPCSSTDAEHFQNLNGGLGSLAEVVSFAQDPTDATTLMAGVGANGTAATSTAGQEAPWAQLAAGEGGYTAIDQVNPRNWYVSTAPGVSIAYCGTGAQCGPADFAGVATVGEPQVDEDASVIDAPWILDPQSTTNVLIGTCRIWRGPVTDGAAWSGVNAISAEFGGSEETACGHSGSFVRSLAAGGPASAPDVSTAANQGSTVIYAGLAGSLDGGGSRGGHVFWTAAADTATARTVWTDLALNPVTNDGAAGGVFNPGGFDISAVAVDPHDATGATVFATVMGFAGNGVYAPRVYRSVDGGSHWTDISSNLPNAPANAVVVDPNDAETVYVAMDTGVYATTAVSSCVTADCWVVLGFGLPNAPVIGLETGAEIPAGAGNSGELRAATYGRGIWEIPLLSASPSTTASVSLTPAMLSFAAEAVGTISSTQTVAVTNAGSAAATVVSLAATGDFSETDSCAGTTLVVGGSCSIQVTFSATAAGPRAGTLTVVYEKAGGSSQLEATATLRGTGEAAASVAINPDDLAFGAVVLGSTSPAQSVTLSNTGGAVATLHPPVVTGDFAMAANGCAGTLAPGAQCSVGIVFAPGGTGTRNGSFSVTASTGTATTSLTGVGEAPATDTVSPGALNFVQQQENVTSAAQTVTLTNTGDTGLTQISASVAGTGFALTNGCGATLTGHSACSLMVTFTPGTVGTLTGTLTVTDALRTQAVLLSGVGYPPPRESVTPAALSFAATAVGATSPVQRLTVSNAGEGLLSLGAVTVTGDFSEVDNCAGETLSATTHCGVIVTFMPTALGTRTGSVTIAGAAAGTGVTVALTGVGATVAAIALSPQSLSFGTVTLGQRSGTLSLTVSNSGGLTGTLGTAAVTGDFQLASDYCGGSLAAESQCAVEVIFAPTAAGARTGVFTISGPLGTLSATLTGTGAAPATDTLSPASLTFGPQQAGSVSSGQTVTVTNSGDAALTGLQAGVSPGSFTLADSCPAVLAGHSQCTLTVRFDPTAAGAISGNLIVGDQIRTQPQIVPLSGTGLAPAQIVLTPASVSFGSIAVGTTSVAQNVTVSNTGGAAATLQVPATTGDFAITANTCGASLAPDVGCTLAVVFSPTTAGARNGRLSIGSSAGTQTASLMGTGLAAATDVLSPFSLSFGAQQYGTASVAQTVTLTNSGNEALTLVSAAIASGNFTLASNCGVSLAGHSSCTLAVAFAPASGGTLTGTLMVSDALRTQTVMLTGLGVAPPLAGLSPATLGFPATADGTTSAAETVTVTNTGGGSLIISSVAVTSGFRDTESCTRVALAAGATCAVQVTFSPVAAGPLAGTLTLLGNMPDGQATAALSGIGAPPAAIVLTPSSLSFGTVTVGGSANPVQNIAVSNTGGLAATLQTPTVTGDFSIAANTCGPSLAASTGCTVAIGFTPTAAGTRTGVFSISDSTGIQTAALTGVGAVAATDMLSPLVLSFPARQAGSTSAAQVVTLTNNGDNALTLILAQITSGDFIAANGCGSTLPGRSSCTIAVSYAPKTVGVDTGVLTVSDQFKSQMVALSGTGIAPPGQSITPGSLTFAALGVGETSVAQTLTVSNNGGAALAISGITATGDFSVPTAGDTCVATVMPGGSCTVQVEFAPTVGGPRAGSVSFADNAAGSPQSVTLSGTGVDFALAADGPASVTVSSGASAAYAVLLSSASGIPGTATLVCTGIPANSICTVTPGSAPLGGSTVISVTVETGVSATGELRETLRSAWWAAVLLPLAIFGRRRGHRRGFVLLGLMILAGCGTGRVIPPPYIGPGGGSGGGVTTPSGTYAIKVAATSAGLTRTVAFTLMVR